MPLPLASGSLWKHVYDEVIMVHAYWSEFNDLYASSAQNVELIQRTAGFFFYVVQDALATDIQLTLSKLSDPSHTGGHTNASIDAICSDLSSHCDCASALRLENLRSIFHSACGNLRTLRNKLIAHSDRRIAERQVTQPSQATLGEVRAAIGALGEVVNEAEKILRLNVTDFVNMDRPPLSAKKLLSELREAETMSKYLRYT